MTLSHHDQLLVQRHVDGELTAPGRAAFEARLAAEPELAAAAAAAAALRQDFVGGREPVMRPPPAFVANVLAAARRLPTRQQLEQADVAASAVGLCRRLLLAAAILAAAGLAWHAGLVRGSEPELQAAPGDIVREIERLDALPTPAEPQRGR